MSDIAKPDEPTSAEAAQRDLDAVAQMAQGVMQPTAKKARAENARWQAAIAEAKAAGRLFTVKSKQEATNETHR